MNTKINLIIAVLAFMSIHVFAQNRIIGGNYTSIEDRPYQAAVYINGQFEGGAVILNKKWILCAAHEVYGKSASSVSVKFGSTDLTTCPNVYTVSQIINHPNYSNSTQENDIALLELATPLTFSNSIQSIALATTTNYPANTDAVVSGWGRFNSPVDSIDFHHLKSAPVNISYQNGTKLYASISDDVPYKGDSGGPLTVGEGDNIKLVGIVSTSDLFHPTLTHVGYTNVGSYYNWIISNIGSQYYLSGTTLINGSASFECVAPGATLEISSNLQVTSKSFSTLNVQARGSGRGYINIIKDNTIKQRLSIWVGVPIISGISYDGRLLKVETFGGDAQIYYTEWYVGGNMFSAYEDFLYYTGGYGMTTVRVRARNACGFSQEYTENINLSNGFYLSSTNVDTSNKNISIILQGNEDEIVEDNISYELRNLRSGKIYSTGSIEKNNNEISYAALPAGIYVLRLQGDKINENIKINLQ